MIQEIDQMDYITPRERVPKTMMEKMRVWSKRRKHRWLEKQISDLELEIVNLVKAKSHYQHELKHVKLWDES